jgi:hypothetical protein
MSEKQFPALALPKHPRPQFFTESPETPVGVFRGFPNKSAPSTSPLQMGYEPFAANRQAGIY